MWTTTTITDDDIIVEERNVEWDEIRSMRDGLLNLTDQYMWTDRFASLTEQQQTELLTYRQALRDLPDTGYDNTDTDTEGANATLLNFPTAPAWMMN